MRSINGALITVKDKPCTGLSLRQRHVQCCHGQRRSLCRVHRPTHDTTGIQVQHDSQVKPSLPGTHGGHVAYPNRVRSGDVKGALDQVWRRRLHTLHRLNGAKALDTGRLDILELAQPPDAMLAAFDAFGIEQAPHLYRSRRPAMRRIEPDDVGTQGKIFLATQACSGFFVRVIQAAADIELTAQRLDWKLAAVLVDERVLYFFRRVKYASNFFKIASSSWALASSRRNCSTSLSSLVAGRPGERNVSPGACWSNFWAHL